MTYLITTSDPNIARKIVAANPGTFIVHGQNGQIHIYAGGDIPAQRQAKAPPKPTKPLKPAARELDYFPWWVAAAALLSIIFALILK